MHPIQQKILDASKEHDVVSLGLRPLGRLIGVDQPQLVKHHLEQLQKKGLLSPKSREQLIEHLQHLANHQPTMLEIPILGSASCGVASWVAEQNTEGYLPISESLIGKRGNLFALKATGTSMNRANINGKNIEEDDYVVIDGDYKSPHAGDYVLSIIDGLANIKKFARTKDGNIALLSESTDKYAPIIINENDHFFVNGKVVRVIKSVEEQEVSKA